MDAAALIIEDHPLYRDALLRALHPLLGETAVATASTAEEALRMAQRLPLLRLILLDLGLPGLRGVEALTALQGRYKGVPIIVVSASEDRFEANAALRAGARAFLSKALSTETLTETLRRLLAGELPTPEWITPDARGSIDSPTGTQLTPRQREMLLYLSRGYSNKEISLRLGLAEITVKVHVSALFKTLGVVNRTQAVMAGRRLGLAAGEGDAAGESSEELPGESAAPGERAGEKSARANPSANPKARRH